MELVSERLVLRRTRKEDFAFLKDLWNDGCVMRWVGFPNGVGYTDESILAWFDRRASEPRFHHFIICLVSRWQLAFARR
jgi:RimJ/RimL family protein N-acetyltransferase